MGTLVKESHLNLLSSLTQRAQKQHMIHNYQSQSVKHCFTICVLFKNMTQVLSNTFYEQK